VVWSPTASHAAALCVRNDGQHVRCVTRWMEDRLATPNARG
jgi:hypothetical protein